MKDIHKRASDACKVQEFFQVFALSLIMVAFFVFCANYGFEQQDRRNREAACEQFGVCSNE